MGAGEDPFHGIGDVGVIARGGAIPIDGDWFPGENASGEFMDGQIGPLARTVNGEETKHGDIHPIDMVIDMAEGFTGQLAGGVG